MTFIQAKHGYFDGSNKPRWIVVHDMEYPKRVGSARWCANFFATTSPSSAHYCVDPAEVIQSVREEDGAWHTHGYAGGVEINRASIGIEHAGYYTQTREQWLDELGNAELDLSAKLSAEIAERWDIPIRRLSVEEIRAGLPGFAGHHDFVLATRTGSHVDPGVGFPWDVYLSRVQRYSGGEVIGPLLVAASLTFILYVAHRNGLIRLPRPIGHLLPI